MHSTPRHPFLWGVALLAAGHLFVIRDAAGGILFGTLLIVALTGTVSIDRKRRQSLGGCWEAFAVQTSNVPLAAVLSGRQEVRLGEIGWRPLGVAIGVWLALAVFHPYLFGGRALL